MNVQEAAEALGVSARMVYQLAAPNGPIPCYRIGKRIIFDFKDVQEYRQSCLSTEIKREVVSSLNSTAGFKAKESALLSTFRKLGIKPRLTHTTGKNRQDSTPSQPESNGLNSPLRMLSSVT